jgi:hypothetical protein
MIVNADRGGSTGTDLLALHLALTRANHVTEIIL